MRLVGLLLVLAGASVTYLMGIKGDSPAQMRKDLLAYFHIADSAPGASLPSTSLGAAANG